MLMWLVESAQEDEDKSVEALSRRMMTVNFAALQGPSVVSEQPWEAGSTDIRFRLL